MVSRRVRPGLQALTLAALVAGGAAPGSAQPALPAVTVVLTLEIRDPEGWARLHYEILATAPGAAKSLVASAPARTGGSRALSLAEPKFTPTVTLRGAQTVRLVVRGRVGGADAVETVPPFVHSLGDAPPGAPGGRVTLEYGLTTVAADLVELRVEER
jgi:hypothetical protein